MSFRLAASLFVSLLLPAICAPAGELGRYEFHETHMGMPFELQLYAENEVIAKKAARAAFARIHEIDERLSDYNADSELNQLCETAGSGKVVPVSDDLFAVLQKAVALAKASDGAFDPTVGPLVRLWRISRRRKALPAAEELAAARGLVDYRQVILDAKTRTVTLGQPKMQLDLGGIAVGYAVDEALKQIRENGVTRAMLDGSGDIGVSDAPPASPGWRIGIAPLDPKGPPSRHVVLKNAAVTTSGDAFQFVEIRGTRYSHIVDPQTGLGLTRRTSVTVIATDCTTADSYATAVAVLGPEKGIRLIEATPDAAVLIVQAADGRPETFMSKRLDRYSAPRN